MEILSGNPWDLFPEHIHLGTDEYGNEIVVDTTKGGAGSVFGLWHDPSVVVVLATSQAQFRTLAPKFGVSSKDRTLPHPIEELINLPKAQEPICQEDAARTLGSSYAPWVRSFPSETAFIDLREAIPGTGFRWDLADTFAKHPESAIFAILAAPRRRGWLSRLLGR